MNRDMTLLGRTRDRLAWFIANAALKYIATPWYRGMIDGAIWLGLESAAKKAGS